MIAYTVRRLAFLVAVIWLVVTATFALMHFIPGGPFDQERAVPPAVLAAIEERYRLNDPLWRQYVEYFGQLLRLDLGPSFKHEGRTVNDIIASGFRISAVLGFLSVLLSVGLGVPLGVMSAVKRNSPLDHSAMLLAIGFVSVPSFVLCSALIFLFANARLEPLYFLPPVWGSGGAALPGETASLKERILPLVIPVVSLAGFSLAYITRLTRAGMIEVLSQDYIRTARAKGLGPLRVILKHGLRNALAPVATYLGPLVAGVFTGSFVIETIYNIPGLGRHFVTSIYNRDYPVILGVTIFYSVFLALMNLAVDLAYPILDPRVAHQRERGA